MEESHRGWVSFVGVGPNRYRTITFTPDGGRLIFSQRRPEAKIVIWNLNEERLEREFTELDNPICVCTDGKMVAVGDFEGDVCCWDLESGRLIKGPFKAHPRITLGVALSPDGRILATGGNDQLIRLWDTTSFAMLGTLRGHRDEVWSLRFAHDGQLLASASKDQTVKLWRLTDLEEGS